MRRTYSKPRLTVHGNVEDITRANQVTQAEDGIFDAGNQIGTSIGSEDACISENLNTCDNS